MSLMNHFDKTAKRIVKLKCQTVKLKRQLITHRARSNRPNIFKYKIQLKLCRIAVVTNLCY